MSSLRCTLFREGVTNSIWCPRNSETRATKESSNYGDTLLNSQHLSGIGIRAIVLLTGKSKWADSRIEYGGKRVITRLVRVIQNNNPESTCL
jgi:hypothetical protein